MFTQFVAVLACLCHNSILRLRGIPGNETCTWLSGQCIALLDDVALTFWQRLIPLKRFSESVCQFPHVLMYNKIMALSVKVFMLCLVLVLNCLNRAETLD